MVAVYTPPRVMEILTKPQEYRIDVMPPGAGRGADIQLGATMMKAQKTKRESCAPQFITLPVYSSQKDWSSWPLPISVDDHAGKQK
jgi:hypothetical protein